MHIVTGTVTVIDIHVVITYKDIHNQVSIAFND